MAVDLKSILNKSWTPRFLCGVFLLLLLIELSWGIRAYFFPAYLQTKSVHRNAQITKETMSEAREEVLKFPLFGEYLPEDLAGVAVHSSTLHVKLVGVIFSPEEKKSEVILQFQQGNQSVFHVGDTIPGGAIIKRITESEVYMMRNGAIEYLFLPEKDIKFDPPAPPLLGD